MGSSLPASLYTVCSACTSSGYLWCGGSDQKCVASMAVANAQCPSSAYPTFCSSSSSSSSSGYLFNGLCTYFVGGSDETPRSSVAAGIAISVVVSLLLLPLLLCKPGCSTPRAAPGLVAFFPAVQQAYPLAAAGYCCLTFGLLFGLAAPAIPWCYSGRFYSTGLVYSGFMEDFAYPNSYLLGGSLVIYLGLVLVLAAWAMGAVVAVQLRGIARTSTYTAPPSCRATMPAIEGCVWAGLSLVLIGSTANWLLFRALFAPAGPSGSPGPILLGVAVLCLLCGAILFSRASCLLKGMPGLGTSRRNCCCAEGEAGVAPLQHAAPPAQYYHTPQGAPEGAHWGAEAALAGKADPQAPEGSGVQLPAPQPPPAPASSAWDNPEALGIVAVIASPGPLGMTLAAGGEVRRVAAGGLAAQAGILAGYVLLAINGAPVEGLALPGIHAVLQATPRPLTCVFKVPAMDV
jgi:hypothetical protein